MNQAQKIILAMFSFESLIVASLLMLGSTQAVSVESKAEQKYELATFGGGCFWCMEKPFDELEGVVSTVAGYIGGEVLNPTYRQVASGGTGHAEVVQVKYNPETISYESLLEVYWKNVDPKNASGQFCDVGDQYRTAIFFHGDKQKVAAEKSHLSIAKKLGPIVTTLEKATKFYPAEGYHQDYYEYHPENPYVQSVSRPKVEKVKKVFKDILKEKYKK